MQYNTYTRSTRMQSTNKVILEFILFMVHYMVSIAYMKCICFLIESNSHSRPHLSYPGSAGEKQMKVVKFLLEQDPSCASRTTAEGELPLHIACNGRRRAVGRDVIGLLFDCYPDAVHVTDRVGKTPLDIAKESSHGEASSFLMEQINDFFLYASRVSDIDTPMMFPIHHALCNDVTLGVIKLLVDRYPGLENIANHEGRLPVHDACERGSVEAVNYLVQRDQGCLNVCDDNNNYPLHFACRGGNCSVVKYLLDKRTGSVSERNNDSKLPIQLLFEADCEDEQEVSYTETIWCLLLAYPETVLNY